MADNKDIILETGEHISYYVPDISKILNRSTIVYGPPETGKTTVIIDFLFRIKNLVPNIVVFTKTKSNGSFDGIVPPECIMDDMDLKKRNKTIAGSIKDIIERQKRAANTYAHVNRKENLESVCSLAAGTKSFGLLKRCIGIIQQKSLATAKKIMAAGLSYDKTESLKEWLKTKTEEQIKELMKKYITKFKKELNAKATTPSQKKTCQYIDFNPRIAMVLEDISDVLKEIGKDKMFLEMMSNIRWYHITLFIAIHYDKFIPPAPRQFAFQSVFTTAAGASTFTSTKENGFSAADRKVAAIYINGIFGQNSDGDGSNFNKLVYTRAPKDNKPFKYWIAKKHRPEEFFHNGKALSWSQILWDRFNKVNKGDDDVVTLKLY